MGRFLIFQFFEGAKLCRSLACCFLTRPEALPDVLISHDSPLVILEIPNSRIVAINLLVSMEGFESLIRGVRKYRFKKLNRLLRMLMP